MDPVDWDAVCAAFELFWLFVDDTIAVLMCATMQDAQYVVGDSSNYWLTRMLFEIVFVDRLIAQKYTSELDNLW